MGVAPLSSHAILVLLFQLCALLVVARLGSELVKRLGLPSVVGELAGGILLGPTVLGHWAPQLFIRLFPAEAEQFHLLEVVSWLGMIFLLVLTGLETDVRLLKNLGRTAFGASIFGMVVPFAFGAVLGWEMPDRYVAAPDHRLLFAAFLATALAISAMPVIAKILLDLDLTRRNIGVVILSAGVVDDTTGWIILSVIAGVATGGARVDHLAISIGGTLLFVVAAALVLYPILRFAFRIATDRFASKNTDLVLLVVVTFVCGAVTDLLGVHAVFGAFVAGCIMRQVPRLRPGAVHELEAFTHAILAPVFFGIVGLKVDLWTLHGGRIFGIVLGVAVAGKLLGCTAGALLGGLRFWESMSIAVAMNARGAMGLVVALIGLSLGILNEEMYSIVVMVAVVTSFMAPVLLRLTMRMVRVTEDEAERIAAEEAKGLFDAQGIRVLVPTAGGPNALGAARFAMTLAGRSSHPVTILYVDRTPSALGRLWRRIFPSHEGQNLAQHLDTVGAIAKEQRVQAPEIRRDANRDVSAAVHAEAAKGYDLILVGASGKQGGVHGNKLEMLVEGAPCHVAVFKPVGDAARPLPRILVPVDGSFPSRVGIELAVRYAEGLGDAAEVTLVLVLERDDHLPRESLVDGSWPDEHSSWRRAARPDRATLSFEALTREGGLEKLSPVFKATKVRTRVMVPASVTFPVLAEAASGEYDLVVLGAEHRAIHHRLFFGSENERLVERAPVSVVLVVPVSR
jgi:Kef-type K+ transport system membrane component KefB